jgi:hypothetical protein
MGQATFWAMFFAKLIWPPCLLFVLAGEQRRPSRFQQCSWVGLLGVCLLFDGDHVDRRLRRHCLLHEHWQGLPDPLPGCRTGKSAAVAPSMYAFRGLDLKSIFFTKNEPKGEESAACWEKKIFFLRFLALLTFESCFIRSSALSTFVIIFIFYYFFSTIFFSIFVVQKKS